MLRLFLAEPAPGQLGIRDAADCAIISPGLKTRIGHLLVRDGLVTQAQLARALEVQSVAGGRIGTLLLERAALAEDDLGKMLALQHGCGYVSWMALSAPAPESLSVLPARFALKHHAIPYESGEGYVKMALRDPSDLRALDELVFVTGRKIIVGVAQEVRIYQALEKHYGKHRAPRYAILAEKLSRLQKVAQTATIPEATEPASAPAGPTDPTPSAGRQTPAPGKTLEPARAAWPPFLTPPPEAEGPGEPEGIAWDDPTGSRSRPKLPKQETPSLFPKPGPRRKPLGEVETLESADFQADTEGPLPDPFPPSPEKIFGRLLAATDRESIADAVLAVLVTRFPVAAIFSSRSEGLTGWAAAGKDVDPSALQSFSVSWAEPSVFLNARLSHNFYLGPLPALRCHDRLAAALGGWPGECLVQPVFLGDRPVAFIYVSAPSAGSFSASDMTFVQGLCDSASTAIGNAIRLRKRDI